MTTAAPARPVDSASLSGWVDAGLYVLAIGVLSLIYAISNAWSCHVAVFILYSLLVSAVALLAITGFGANARAVIGAWHTWVVGLSNIVMETAYVLLLGYLAPINSPVHDDWLDLAQAASVSVVVARRWYHYGDHCYNLRRVVANDRSEVRPACSGILRHLRHRRERARLRE
jgi:hypothetical protein